MATYQMVTIATPSAISEAIGSAVDTPPSHTQYLALELNRAMTGEDLLGILEGTARCPFAIVDCVPSAGDGRLMAWFKDPGVGLFASQAMIVLKVTGDENLAAPSVLISVLESITASSPSTIDWDTEVFVDSLSMMAWLDVAIPE